MAAASASPGLYCDGILINCAVTYNNKNGLLWIALQPKAELPLKYMSYAKRDMHYDKYVKRKDGE